MDLAVYSPPTVSPQGSGVPCLRLTAGLDNPLVMPMAAIQEVLVVDRSRVTVMPAMTSLFLGLINHRSRVYWLVDFASLLGGRRQEGDRGHYQVVLLRQGEAVVGLVCHRIEGVLRLQETALQSPLGAVSAALVPYLRGCVLLDTPPAREVLLLLDPGAILRSPLLHSFVSKP